MSREDQSDINQLSSLLCAAVTHAISYLLGHGISPELPRREYVVRWMAKEDELRSIGKEETRNEPTFALPESVRAGLWELPAVQSFLSAAAAYAKTEGNFVVGLSSRTPEDLAKGLLISYFIKVGALRLEEQTIAITCRTFTGELSSDTATIQTIFQITGFSAEEAFTLTPEITFRPINAADIDQFGRINELAAWVGQSEWLNDTDWVCEITRLGTKTNTIELNRHRELGERIAVALNLSTPGRAIFTLVANHLTSIYLNFGTTNGGAFIATSRIGERIRLTKEVIKELQWTYAKVAAIEEQKKYEFLRLPLRRLRMASTRQEAEDQLVDYVIGLERLLASDTEQLETTFRFRLRGAVLLPARFGNTTERIKLMNRLYALRSDIVHGSATAQEIAELLPTAEDILREILRWYLTIIETLDDPRKILKKLDESLVEGGSTWAVDVLLNNSLGD